MPNHFRNLILQMLFFSLLGIGIPSTGFAIPTDLTGNSSLPKNKILNGNFDIWQRGTSIEVSTPDGEVYTADRWVANNNIGANNIPASAVITREDFPLGQTDIPGEPRHFLKWHQTRAGTSLNDESPILSQKIEGVRTLAGENVTVSFWIKTPGKKLNVDVYFYQYFGSGSASPGVISIPSDINTDEIWQKFEHTFTLEGIAGKNIIEGEDYLELVIEFPMETGFTAEIAQVQVESGSVATGFEKRPLALELALCKRYFQKVGAGIQGNFGKGNINNSGLPPTAVFSMLFPVAMRVTPTESFSGDSVTVQDILANEVLTASPPTSHGSFLTQQGGTFSIGGFTGSVAGNPIIAGQEFVFDLDAELYDANGGVIRIP